MNQRWATRDPDFIRPASELPLDKFTLPLSAKIIIEYDLTPAEIDFITEECFRRQGLDLNTELRRLFDTVDK